MYFLISLEYEMPESHPICIIDTHSRDDIYNHISINKIKSEYILIEGEFQDNCQQLLDEYLRQTYGYTNDIYNSNIVYRMIQTNFISVKQINYFTDNSQGLNTRLYSDTRKNSFYNIHENTVHDIVGEFHYTYYDGIQFIECKYKDEIF
jgi:hypothetical protein